MISEKEQAIIAYCVNMTEELGGLDRHNVADLIELAASRGRRAESWEAAAVLANANLRDLAATAALEQARSSTMTNAQLAVRAYKTADAFLRVRDGAVLCLGCEGFGYVNAAVNGMHEPRRVERAACSDCKGSGLVEGKP